MWFVQFDVGVTSSWQILNGSASYYTGPHYAYVTPYTFVRMEGTLTNQCGSTSTTFYVQDVSGGYYRMTSPNPATSIISTDIIAMETLKKVTLVREAHPGVVRMYNANGSLNADTHRNNNILSFDTGNLPRGLYYLNFTFDGNKTFTEQIMLN